MVHACRVVAEVAAAVRRDEFQPEVALEHAPEDEVRQRERGVERVADDVGEEVLLQPAGVGEAARVEEDDGAQVYIMDFSPFECLKARCSPPTS
jgi:hypothetical protein